VKFGKQRFRREAPRENSRWQARSAQPLATLFHSFGINAAASLLVLIAGMSTLSQTRTYPKEIRGYKVERAAVEMKTTAPKPTTPDANNKSQNENQSSANTNQNPKPPDSEESVDQLITFGPPELARVTPLGITFDVPIVVAPIRQSGHVEFLLFEDMTVNNHSVEIDEYHRAFDLPTKRALKLREPLRFFISTPTVALAAVDEWSNSKETWPVTGRVYVCGKYKKFLIKFKRCVPVELNLAMRNPLKEER